MKIKENLRKSIKIYENRARIIKKQLFFERFWYFARFPNSINPTKTLCFSMILLGLISKTYKKCTFFNKSRTIFEKNVVGDLDW